MLSGSNFIGFTASGSSLVFSLSYLLSGIAINVDMSPLTILRSSLLHLSHITFYPPDAPFIVEFETNHCINSPPCTMLPFFFSHPYYLISYPT